MNQHYKDYGSRLFGYSTGQNPKVPQKVILTKKIKHKENNLKMKSCGKAKASKRATYQRNLKKLPQEQQQFIHTEG